MKRSRVAAGLFFLLALGAFVPAQQDVKKFFDKLEDDLSKTKKAHDEAWEQIIQDMKRQEERVQPFWHMFEAEVLKGESKLRSAAGELDKAASKFAQTPPGKLTAQDAVTYRELLLQLAPLHVVMGEPEEAVKLAERAWNLHQEVVLPSRPKGKEDKADALATAVAVALVFQSGNQQNKAVPLIYWVITECQHMPAPLNQPDHNAILGDALCLKSALANSSGNYAEALRDGEQAEKSLHKRYPLQTHPKLAGVLANLAEAHLALGEFDFALERLREAEKILGQDSQRWKPQRALLYRLRGQLHFQRREDALALTDLETAKQLFVEVFPAYQFPRSHPLLIMSLTSLADLLNHFARSDAAIKLAEEALKECGRRYQGAAHEQKVTTLLSYGCCLRDAGKVQLAEVSFRSAVDLADKLLPTRGPRRGLCCLPCVGCTLAACWQGRVAPRRRSTLLRECQATYQLHFPRGHPHLFKVATDLGSLALRQGNRAEARVSFVEALKADQQQLRQFGLMAAQIETLTFSQPRELALHGYLSASRNDAALDEHAYDWVWSAKGAITRLEQVKYVAQREAQTKDQRVQQILDKMVDTSARLRQELLTARTDCSLTNLLEELDRLEVELKKVLPKTALPLVQPEAVPADLAERLPPGSAFIDFVRYDDVSGRPEAQSRYVAFLILRGRKPVRIDLETPGPQIDQAINRWRQAVAEWDRRKNTPAVQDALEEESDRQAVALQRDLWKPIADHLPGDIRLLLLAPAGDLARLPFAALPGADAQTILLEKFSIGYVPHGPFLLEQFSKKEKRPNRPDRFLAVGAVDYGPPGVVPKRNFTSLLGSQGLIELANGVKASRPTTILSKEEATVAAVLRELPEANEAHFSTHGFFDAEGWAEERRQLQETIRNWTPLRKAPVGHVGLGRRFPLSFVGLALAGANKPVKAGQGDGILTGEPIPRLFLQWLRLAILDACETGEGQVTGGEGVQGLQRAFHLAGCPNVVATLWRTSKMAPRKPSRGNSTSICGKTSSQHWKPCARPSSPCTRTPAACRFRLRGAESRSSLPATLLPICYRTVTANANEVTRSCGELPSFIPGLDIHSWTRRNWPPRSLHCQPTKRLRFSRPPSIGPNQRQHRCSGGWQLHWRC